jgi:hypothetical protein
MGGAMLVYGDPKRRERADILCETIAAQLRALEDRSPGLERHAALVGIFIKAGELVQGLSDLEFESLGVDEISARRETSGVLLLDLARLVAQSWSQGFSGRLGAAAAVDQGGRGLCLLCALSRMLHGSGKALRAGGKHCRDRHSLDRH